VLTGRNQEKLEALKTELSGEYLLVRAEASSTSDSQQLIEKTIETYGKIDILFLNAGVFRLEGINELTEDIYDEVYDINVKGPLFTVKMA
ncbi:SDR family oxidoreductase, partial [Maribacter flavus]